MIWTGKKPICIGTVDEATGKAKDAIVIKPGEVIPDEWMAVIKEAGEAGTLHSIGHVGGDEDVTERVIDADLNARLVSTGLATEGEHGPQ